MMPSTDDYAGTRKRPRKSRKSYPSAFIKEELSEEIVSWLNHYSKEAGLPRSRVIFQLIRLLQVSDRAKAFCGEGLVWS